MIRLIVECGAARQRFESAAAAGKVAATLAQYEAMRPRAANGAPAPATVHLASIGGGRLSYLLAVLRARRALPGANPSFNLDLSERPEDARCTMEEWTQTVARLSTAIAGVVSLSR